jgi:uncharacterized membrane protein YqjE
MPDPKSDNLPGLVGRLGEDIVTLVDSKLGLLKVEIKEDATAYVRGSIGLVTGGVVLAVGFALVNVAVALLVSMLLQRTELAQPARYVVGFLIPGALYLVVGFVLTKRATGRLSSIDPAPERSIEELGQDKQWLGQSKRAVGKARKSHG